MKRLWRHWVRFWETDKSLSALLLMLIAVAFVVPPVTGAETSRGLFGNFLFSLLLVSGVAAVRREKPWIFHLVAAIALGSLIARWLARFVFPEDFEKWNAASDIVAMATFALVVLGKVLRPGTITRHRLEGAVAVYLLIGLLWANAYEWVWLVHPGAFTGSGLEGGGGWWTYYSFVTLTTMGYGDITPLHPIARSLAGAQALTGQLYLAILISRLVALEVSARGMKL